MPVFLAIPTDELHLGETTLQVLDQELFILAHQDRHQSLAAGCDQDPAGEESPGRWRISSPA